MDEKIHPLISFDGPPEYQDNQRPFKDGSGSYDIVYANIQKLRSVLPSLMIRATVYDASDPFLIKDSIAKAGLTICHLSKASPAIITTNESDTMPPDNMRMASLQRMIAYNNGEINEVFDAIKRRMLKADGPHKMLAAMESRQKLHYACGIGKEMIAVSVTGDIYPCHRFAGHNETRMGNIFEEDIGNGLNDYYRAVVDNLPECRQCWVRYYCGGGCFYHNKAHTGDMHRPEKFDCAETKVLFEGLIHTYCQLDEEDKKYLKKMLNVNTPEHNL